jgi:hypothetical protein
MRDKDREWVRGFVYDAVRDGRRVFLPDNKGGYNEVDTGSALTAILNHLGMKIDTEKVRLTKQNDAE